MSPNNQHPNAEQLRAKYEAAGQGHVFTFFDTLSPSDQSSLLAQLETIDVERVNRIFSTAIAADQAAASGSTDEEEVLPLPESATATIVGNPTDEASWRDIGLKAIAENEVAVLLMAGGQGTRLGSSSPKGMYDIQLPSGMTLFEIQARRIKKLEEVAAQRAGKAVGDVKVRWYVMTSGPTRKETERYFGSKGFFGLDKADVVFFEQGEWGWDRNWAQQDREVIHAGLR